MHRSRRLNNSIRHEIAPDEIFLDSSNLPKFDVYQFEGRLEKPITKSIITVTGVFFLLIGVLLLSRAWLLQVKKGEAYALLSERNSLRHEVIFAPRGLIEDRNGQVLVSNIANQEHIDYPSRQYVDEPGFAHVLGFVEYPKKDAAGVFFRHDFVGKEGVEARYNDVLTGQNGIKISETNALGQVESESVLRPPRYGMKLSLSIDARLQGKLYSLVSGLAHSNGFQGGAAAIMDIETGEMVSLVSFPEFDPTVISEGEDTKAIQAALTNKNLPFLNRAVSGLYTPGSIVKPFLALGALEEGIIDPKKTILSSGSISIPNPYDPSKKSIFTDWKAHGLVDMREALAVSSNVYFYAVGGGFEDQRGLGISRIEKYMRLFGFGEAVPKQWLLETNGTIPNPEWKAENFNGEQWRLGDTYNTAIGQYGVQVTPMQVLRGVAALANGGSLLEPTLILGGNQARVYRKDLSLNAANLKVVQEGMRDAVRYGTAKNLDIPQVAIAAKTGTAELGAQKRFVNSWVTGFFPYERPRYAFVVIMERGPRENTVGALYVMRQFFEWLSVEAPEYIKTN